jgi:3-oxoacyl-[acyl-carrier protein] reductase
LIRRAAMKKSATPERRAAKEIRPRGKTVTVPAVAPQPSGPQSMSLAGRTALITGSSKGLGKAMAMALGGAGAKVAINYKNGREKAEHTFAEFESHGYRGGLFCADVTDPAAVARLVRDVGEQLGPIDILIVNATPDQPHKPIEDYDWAFYQTMLDFFVRSPFLLTRAVLPHLKKQRWGRIVNLGSEVFRLGVPNFSAYVTAKGAQAGWTRSMARELAPWHITVNMVSPGWIPVERHANDPQSEKDAYKATIPLQRWGVPADVGGIVAFLASDAASFITGQDVAVNGGVTVC